MKFSCSEQGGYVHSDGDIQVVGIEGSVAHAERGQCSENHAHSKDCAVKLLDYRSIVAPAYKNEANEEIPAVFGLSIRERIQRWFDNYDKMPDDPVRVELPQKTVKVRDEKSGKMVDKRVDDGDLT